MQYIGYNMNSSVFSNYGLRGAITFAIDREQLVEPDAGRLARGVHAAVLAEVPVLRRQACQQLRLRHGLVL